MERSASVRKSEKPGASSRFIRTPSCSAKVMWVATVKLRFTSSGSTSRWLVDPSLLAREGASWRRSASMMATLRMVLGSSMRWSPGRGSADLTPARTCCGAAAACLVAFAAQAQQADWATAETPAESLSLQDDGTSLGGNPGGLGFTGGLELNFLHNGFSQAPQPMPGIDRTIAGHTEALYGTVGGGPLTLGLGVDWLHRNGTVNAGPAGNPFTIFGRR